jgi:phosphopantothenoylcysteine decarboxylase/phosphopantothenate--cysteine ligase
MLFPHADMFMHAKLHFPSADIAVMSAAVADFTSVNIADEKIKKQSGNLELSLVKQKIFYNIWEVKKHGINTWLGLHWKPIMRKRTL